MKKIFRKRLAFVSMLSLCISLSGCTACDAFFEGFREGFYGTGGSSVEFKSNDGKWVITATSSWNSRKALKEGAAIQVSNPVAEKYLIVLQEDKIDLQKGMSLKEYTNLIIRNMSGNLKNPSSTAPSDIVLSGNKARIFELSGTVDETNVKYLVATVESRDKFHQLVFWSLPSKYDKLKEEYMTIMKTYREL